MNENELDKEQLLAISSLQSRCDVDGVATLKFNDGEMFMMSKTFIESLLEKVNGSAEKRVIVFVKTGQILRGV